MRAARAGCVVTVGGEFGMGGIETGIKFADFYAFAGDSGGVRLIRLHAGQAPVALEFCAAPTGGIAGLAGFQVGSLRNARHC